MAVVEDLESGIRPFADFLKKCTSGFHTTMLTFLVQIVTELYTAITIPRSLDNVEKAYGRISYSFGDSEAKWTWGILPLPFAGIMVN